MALDKYKNKDDIKNSTRQSKGEVFGQEDLDLIWITGQSAQYIDEEGRPYIIEKFDETERNNVELTIYDMDDNQLFWQVLPGPIRSYSGIQPNTIVLSPGDDLRAAGFIRGQFRVVYEFYRDILGSSQGDKLYVEDISPSRLELRARPVKTADNIQNATFNEDVDTFSDNGIAKQEFISFITSEINNIEKDTLLQSKKGLSYNTLTEELFSKLKATTIRYVSEATNTYDKDILIVRDQNYLFVSQFERIMSEVFNDSSLFSSLVGGNFRWYMDPGVVQIGIEWQRFLISLSLIDNYSGNIDYYLNFGDGKTFPITNWLRDDRTYPDRPYSIVFKLYEPLSREVKEKQQLWISRQITRPVIEKVFVLGLENEMENGLVLRPANFDVNIGGTSGREVGYESWFDLISTQPSTSQAILDHFISASDSGEVPLNIDYGDYSNFIHFGSAEERLKNFKYKLERIEEYEEKMRLLNTYSQSAYVSQSVAGFRTKIRQLRNEFDSYERHLYYISGSQYSGSLVSNGEYLFNSINEWPKQNSKYPYTLYGTTASLAVSWYNDQLAIAQRFDTDNIYNFRNNLPAYIQVDPNNEDYLNFMYMIGQHFDTIFTYIKQLTNVANRDESLYEGLAKDLTYHVASAHGFDLWNGNDNAELWRWAFGYDQYGTYHTGSISGSGEDWLPYSDVSKEVWRRILNNMPYIMKSKGTKRSIEALLSCYGIPTSLLTIREYGGPDPREYENFTDKSAWIFEDFVYAIDFEGSQSVQSSWAVLTGSNYPQTIEFRFASAPTYYNVSSSVGLGDLKPTQSLVATDNWSINLVNSGSGFGFVQFAINDGVQEWSIKTDRYRYYDNEFSSVMLVYTGSYLQLWMKKAEGDRIIEYSSASLSASLEISGNFFADSDLFIAGEYPTVTNWGQNFTGSIQEFKMYNVSIDERTFINHTRWPKSYNSIIAENTYEDLALRYSFDNPKNHSSDAVVSDVKANQTYTTPGTAQNFDDYVNYTPRTEEFAAVSPNIGAGRFINNKIRREDNELLGDLSPRQRVEISSFDRAPVDSPRLGIYFSPLDAINKDIIATYAGIDLLGKIGDPRDRYEDNYRDLKELQWKYWSKYNTRPQFNDFIRTIKQFDQSFFNQLRSLLPARSRPSIGTLIEPTILERYKVEWERPTYERPDYSGNSIQTQTYITQSWQKYDFDANLKLTYTSASEYILYEGTVATIFAKSSSYYAGEQQFIPMISPVQEAQTGSFNIRKVYNRISSSVNANGSITYQRVSSYIGGDGKTKYSGFYYVYDLNQHNWLLEYRELQNNLWYGGTLNTIDTTVDGKEPVEVFFTNPNKLKATDQGPSRIIVE